MQSRLWYAKDESDDDDEDDTEEVDNLLSKISVMMYTFGDVKKPLKESVQLMHLIIREQINILLIDAEDLASHRGSKEISHEEILFIMRRNKAKLKHLLQYLHVLDLKPSLMTHNKFIGDELALTECNKYKKTRLTMCLEFLSSIEDTKEYTLIMEDKAFEMPEHARKRWERRNLRIEQMDEYEYKEFCKHLQVSFCPAQRIRQFKKWLLLDQVTDMKLSKLAIIIIAFLVREIIAEIVDMSLYIKSKKVGEQQNLNYINNSFGFSSASNGGLFSTTVQTFDHSSNISLKEIHVVSSMDSQGNIASMVDSGGSSEKSNQNGELSNLHAFNKTLSNESSALISDPVLNLTSDYQPISPVEGSVSSNCSNYVVVSEDSSKSSSELVQILSDDKKENEKSDSCSVFEAISPANNPEHSDISDDGESSSGILEYINLSTASNPSETSDKPRSFYDLQMAFNRAQSSLQTQCKAPLKNPPSIVPVSDTEDGNPETSKQKITNVTTGTPITPEEIREAFVLFNEPPTLLYYISDYPVRNKKKFFLARTSTNDI